jgi:hypothetical protein
MSENTRTKPDPMSHECPVCAAGANQPCRTRGGREAEYPHIRRQLLVDEELRQQALRRASRVRALCCQCGNLRTMSTGYHRNDDNRTFEDNRHPLGWRCTTTLKCSICRDSTRHAVLRDDEDRPEFRDIAETRQHLRAGEGLPFGAFRR